MAGETLYGRRARLSVSIPVAGASDFHGTTRDNLVIEGADAGDAPGLRIAFKVVKTTEKTPNTAEITITNLAAPTRAALQVKGLKVRLEAGYQATGVSTLFLGDVRTVDHVRDGADWNTVIKAGDGERAFQYGRVSESWAAGTQALDVARTIAGRLGLPLGVLSSGAETALGKTLHAGWAAQGLAQRELSRLLGAFGLTWSAQDGQVQIMARGESLTVSIPEIAPDSGLIGSPEVGSPEKKGGPALVKFRSLLLPQARPGARVSLRSERYKGTMKVKKATHTGDTAGGDWFTEIEAVALGR